jgi:uncharacterized membrane protein YhaH (DUF805 family)
MSSVEKLVGPKFSSATEDLIFVVPVLWIVLVVSVKRLHDRDKSAWWLVLFYLVPGVVGSLISIEFLRRMWLVASTLGWSFIVIIAWAFVELACLRGTAGPNRYGPDPLGASAPP